MTYCSKTQDPFKAAWTGVEESSRNKMGPEEKNEFIRKMQMNYYCEVEQGLQTPL